MNLLRCEHCGALGGVPGARCRYCGAATTRSDRRSEVSVSEHARVQRGPGQPTVVRAVAVRDLLSVFVDGVPLGSAHCPGDMRGAADLFVQVAAARTRVRFLDPCASLP